jgi:hypothetical protein
VLCSPVPSEQKPVYDGKSAAGGKPGNMYQNLGSTEAAKIRSGSGIPDPTEAFK